MSLSKVSESRRKSRFQKWRERRTYGEELNQSDIKKIVELNNVLRDDGKRLGIPQVSIEIVPKKYKQLASAASTGYRIKNDGTLNMPTSISFDYRAVDKLSGEELRSLAWHEMGHYIFAHYFPEIDDKYYKDYKSYLVVETFADEFAYKRFGKTFFRAMKKMVELTPVKERKTDLERIEDLKKLIKYRERYRSPYWVALAKELDVNVDYNPTKRRIIGINPRKSVLRGLYTEE